MIAIYKAIVHNRRLAVFVCPHFEGECRCPQAGLHHVFEWPLLAAPPSCGDPAEAARDALLQVHEMMGEPLHLPHLVGRTLAEWFVPAPPAAAPEPEQEPVEPELPTGPDAGPAVAEAVRDEIARMIRAALQEEARTAAAVPPPAVPEQPKPAKAAKPAKADRAAKAETQGETQGEK